MGMKLTLNLTEEGKELASLSIDTDFLGTLGINIEDFSASLKMVNELVEERRKAAQDKWAELVKHGPGPG